MITLSLILEVLYHIYKKPVASKDIDDYSLNEQAAKLFDNQTNRSNSDAIR